MHKICIYAFLALALAACGKSNTKSCSSSTAGEHNVSGQKCPTGEVLVGQVTQDPPVIVCAQVTVECPVSEGK